MTNTRRGVSVGALPWEDWGAAERFNSWEAGEGTESPGAQLAARLHVVGFRQPTFEKEDDADPSPRTVG